MAIGAGKYDDECSMVRNNTGALAAIVIVQDGHKGSGFSCQCLDSRFLASLPNILRTVADQIENDTALSEKKI